MKTLIERPHYANLWISEFPLVVEQTISICEKYDMNSMELGKAFAGLTAFRPQLNALNVYVRKHAQNAIMGTLDGERDTLVSGFYKAVKALEYVYLPEVTPHVEVLEVLLEKHKVQTIAAANRTSETERLTMLENDIAANPTVQAALAALKLEVVTDRLFTANKEYESLFRDYIAEKSTEEHMNVPALRRECNHALMQFFHAVEYCAYAHEDIDYTALVKELNELNSYYRQQLKARATRRRNGKDTLAEEPIKPLTA